MATTTMTEMRATNEERTAGRSAVVERIIAGAIAGMIGAVFMGLWVMVKQALAGIGFWLPMELIDAIWAGPVVIIGGVGYAVGGIVTHMAFAAALGALFALLLPREARWAVALLSGLLYGAVVWAVMAYAVLPWLNPTMSDRVNLMQGTFFWVHLLFGLGLSFTPLLWRPLARAPRRAT